MPSPADDVPDLERLMRTVLRTAMESALGSDWQSTLSGAQQTGITRAGEVARTKRPHEQLRDAWDAVGVDEIASLLRSVWPDGVDHVWPSREHASVDLERLKAFRDKNLHAVGPPNGQITDDEVGALVRRLRVGFEAWRRTMADETGDWWPYIAAMHSNVPEFQFERSGAGTGVVRDAVLNEGDLVTLDAIGVHPTAGVERLRYRFAGAPGLDGLRPDGRYAFEVPRVPSVKIIVTVQDEDDPKGAEQIVLRIKVRPIQR